MEGAGRGMLEKVLSRYFPAEKKNLYYIKSRFRAVEFHETGAFLKTQRNSRLNNPQK